MVKVRENMTGWKMWEHGVLESRLTVIEQAEDYIAPSGTHYAQWLCECNCDKHNKIIARRNDLRNGSTLSCGCLQKEKAKMHCQEDFSKQNIYDLLGEYGIGWTNNTNKEFYFDLEDYDKIKNYCWYEKINKRYHNLQAYDKSSGKCIFFHHLLNFKNHDHIDKNPLNNLKSNLRPATSTENNRNQTKAINNTSGFTGVKWHKPSQKWRAVISIDGKQKQLGSFIDKEDAVKCRLKAEAKYYKEFAPQRHLFEQYGIKYEYNNEK